MGKVKRKDSPKRANSNKQSNYITSKAVTKACRKESYIQRPVRKTEILDAIGNKEMTARMICRELHRQDMNYVRPRISELVDEGILQVSGKAYDKITKRHVSLFRIVEAVVNG